MRIPFLHNVVSAVSFTESSVHWLSATMLAGRMSRVSYTSESFENRDVQSGLSRLVERCQPQHPYVVTHLPEAQVRHCVVDGPGFDDRESLEFWMQAQALDQLPKGTDPDDFVTRFDVQNQTEDSTRIRVTLARRDAVAKRIELLRSVGLEPLRIGSVVIDLPFALAFAHGFRQSHAGAAFLDDNDAAVAFYMHGRFRALHPLSTATADPTEVYASLSECLATYDEDQSAQRIDQLFLIGASHHPTASASPRHFLSEISLHEGSLSVSLSRGKRVSVPPELIPTLALSMPIVYKRLPATNLLSNHAAQVAQQSYERSEAWRAIRYLLATFVTLWLCVAFANEVIAVQSATASNALASISTQVAAIDSARSDLARLRDEVSQAEKLVVERTDAARTMSSIALAVPDSLWLEEVAYDRSQDERIQVHVSGVSFEEQALSAFLQRLEETTGFEQVQLVLSETIAVSALYREAKLRNERLKRFEISFDIASS